MRTRDWVVRMLTVTVCAVILMTAVNILIYGPEHASDTGRTLLADVVKFGLGVIAAFAINKSGNG